MTRQFAPISHSDPRYDLWLKIRGILLDQLPEWFRSLFPVATKTSDIASAIVEALGPGDPPVAQLVRLQKRIARLEYRARLLVEYKPGAGMGSGLLEDLAVELRREEPGACPFCGVFPTADARLDHLPECEVL